MHSVELKHSISRAIWEQINLDSAYCSSGGTTFSNKLNVAYRIDQADNRVQVIDYKFVADANSAEIDGNNCIGTPANSRMKQDTTASVAAWSPSCNTTVLAIG